ncbi:MAG: pyridoxamine kinase [Coriobacteriales bacterium]|jgi:pyridoxine kinase|nr:pyridoxamine kinase [Coriobacteriales bacterium]
MQKRVITIQDISCIGRCSLTVALPIISAAGIETSILPTAILSTHTGGFENYTFRDLTDDINPIIDHWQSLDIQAEAVYTGYLGSDRQQKLIADIFQAFKAKGSLIIVDPAMADNGLLYPAFDNDFALGMRDLCAMADLVVPNLTEAALMLEWEYPGESYDQTYIEDCLRALSGLGPAQVVLTGVSFEHGRIGAAAYLRETDSTAYYFTELIDGYYHGTGDIYSSTLTAAIVNGKPLAQAIKIACDFTVASIKRTHTAGTDPKYGVDFESGLGELAGTLRVAV